MRLTGYICGPRIYEFKGWLFEVTYHSGAWPLKKDGDPREHAGRTFWKIYSEFWKLTEAEQEACRVGGGCHRI